MLRPIKILCFLALLLPALGSPSWGQGGVPIKETLTKADRLQDPAERAEVYYQVIDFVCRQSAPGLVDGIIERSSIPAQVWYDTASTRGNSEMANCVRKHSSEFPSETVLWLDGLIPANGLAPLLGLGVILLILAYVATRLRTEQKRKQAQYLEQLQRNVVGRKAAPKQLNPTLGRSLPRATTGAEPTQVESAQAPESIQAPTVAPSPIAPAAPLQTPIAPAAPLQTPIAPAAPLQTPIAPAAPLQSVVTSAPAPPQGPEPAAGPQPPRFEDTGGSRPTRNDPAEDIRLLESKGRGKRSLLIGGLLLIVFSASLVTIPIDRSTTLALGTLLLISVGFIALGLWIPIAAQREFRLSRIQRYRKLRAQLRAQGHVLRTPPAYTNPKPDSTQWAFTALELGGLVVIFAVAVVVIVTGVNQNWDVGPVLLTFLGAIALAGGFYWKMEAYARGLRDEASSEATLGQALFGSLEATDQDLSAEAHKLQRKGWQNVMAGVVLMGLAAAFSLASYGMTADGTFKFYYRSFTFGALLALYGGYQLRRH